MATTRKRPTTAQEFFDRGILLSDKTPLSVAQLLLDFANTHDLTMSDEVKEAYIVRNPKVAQPQSPDDYTHAIYVVSPAFLRICRRTGLWMPGTISFTGSGDDLIAFATCYTRASITDSSWLEVGAHARRFNYYERRHDGKTPTDRWEFTGDLALATVAEILAARKALGEIVDGINTEAGTLEMVRDARVAQKIEERAPRFMQ